MKPSRKKWMFLILAIINLIVLLSFFYFTRQIRNDKNLKLDTMEIPAHRGDFLF